MAKILIVEDDRHFIQQVRALLDGFGWASGFVIRAEHVFPKLERDVFGLILLDINMPGTSGVSLLKQLKAHPAYHTIPVIMLTAEVEEQVLAECFEYGATDFITKPVKELVFKARIQSALTTQAYIQKIQQQKNALEKQTVELHHNNTHLQQEMSTRKRVEKELKQHREHLEELVEKRTIEVIQANEQLQHEIFVKMQAQEALQESEKKYRTLFESSKDAIVLLDPEKGYIDCNPIALKLFGIESKKQFFELNPAMLSPEHQPDGSLSSEKAMQMIAKTLKDGLHFFEWTHQRMNGEEFPATVLATRLKLGDRDVLQGTIRDITARKQAEEQLKASLCEKEVLLKEIHHRVKNNLQVIASLLYLQSKSIQDEDTRALFSDSRNRVKSMALVHETLYQSGDLSRLNFAAYIRNLIAHVFRSYRGSSGGITSKVNISDISLSIEAAAPCGLMINELVSNALKYAFPNRSGEIQIEMCMDEHNQFVLIVSDNGTGFPKDFDVQNATSLGLRLVNSLVDQLDGTLELQNDEGTTFKIVFTEPNYAKRV